MSFLQHVGRGFGPDWKGIIFRQTYKQLEEIVAKSRRFYPAIIPGATFRSGAMEWVFPQGESLKLRHARRPVDMDNYQGHEYPFVGFDELCNLADQDTYERAKGMCRSPNPNVPKLVRATANPLGAGHLWVKRYFIDPVPPLQPIMDSNGLKRVFIPATIYDNRHLVVGDKAYVARLESISDDNLRRAWLEGDWNVVAGSFFGDVWRSDRNVVRPFRIPSTWYCFRSFDWGSSRPFAVGWWAIADGNKAPDGRYYPRGSLIMFAEWYGAKRGQNGEIVPNEGLRMPSREVARGIMERERAMCDAMKIRINPGPADPAIYARQDGPSVADNMASEGVKWIPADNTRVTGWQQMRERIWGEEDEKSESQYERIPSFYVFQTCTEIIRTLPAAPHDDRIPDDVDTEFEDHCLAPKTLVWTDKGKFPIINLAGKTGFVFGPDCQWHRFKNVRLTRRNAEIVKTVFENDSYLVSTPDHKVLAENEFIETRSFVDSGRYATFVSSESMIFGQRATRIEPAGYSDVYCMEVEDVHCFAVNDGVIVHNCLDAARYACMFRKREIHFGSLMG